MFKTRITKLFHIAHPIIAGPMAYLSGPKLVAAISNAGGLGILVSTSVPSPEELRDEIRKTKSLTDKPFAVNVTLAPLIRPINYEEYFAAAIEEGVQIFETSARSPEPYMKMLKDAGVKVMHRATRTRDVRTAERVGADAVSILGTEAAGIHGPEEVGALIRIPAAVEAVKIPVIAAGGITDARGFVAALALGAEGILMGTRFMASQECGIHPNMKQWLLGLSEADTMIYLRSIGNAGRVAKTEYTTKIQEMEEKGAALEEILPYIEGRRGQDSYITGDVSNASISVGQSVGLIHDIPTVKEIIDGIIEGAEAIIESLHNLQRGKQPD